MVIVPARRDQTEGEEHCEQLPGEPPEEELHLEIRPARHAAGSSAACELCASCARVVPCRCYCLICVFMFVSVVELCCVDVVACCGVSSAACSRGGVFFKRVFECMTPA